MTASLPYITRDSLPATFGWRDVVNAMREAHYRPRPMIKDQFIERGHDAYVNRAAWIDGIGIGTKSFTVFPENSARNLPSVQGAMLVFDDQTGAPRALLDSDIVTYWKTAADSVLGAQLLARKDSAKLLVVGTGVVATSLIKAYTALFPRLDEISVWGRDSEKAKRFSARMMDAGYKVQAVANLQDAVSDADIIASATLAKDPILGGEWIRPGTHIDLIGAFKADMREADDVLLQRARIFVDSYETTLSHIGELLIPISSGAITRADVLGDLYSLVAGQAGRQTEEDITVFKNGGGAHLDLMTCNAILTSCEFE